MKKIIFMTLFLLVAMTGQSKGKGSLRFCNGMYGRKVQWFREDMMQSLMR